MNAIIIETIINILNKSIDVEIDVNTKLTDIDINSIIFIKLIVAMEEAFKFEFDDDMLNFTAFSTIKSLAEYVESKISLYS